MTKLHWNYKDIFRALRLGFSAKKVWMMSLGLLVGFAGYTILTYLAYAAAGIIDYDGTYLYALDALTGQLKWQNVTSGHLAPDLRKGISAQGILTIADGRLWMPGGNVVSPAAYDLQCALVYPEYRDVSQCT